MIQIESDPSKELVAAFHTAHLPFDNKTHLKDVALPSILAQLPSISYSPSSSSNSPSSSAVASWYCWYSETRSFMFDSASVNSISSIPSPVYQWRNALRRKMAVKNSATRLNISWIAVELPRKVTAILRPFGGISQMPVLILLGIHSTK